MLNLRLCCILILLPVGGAMAQTYSSFVKYGDQAYEAGDWGAALYAYQSALQLRDQPEARVKAIGAALEFHTYDLALKWSTELYEATADARSAVYRPEAALLAGKACRAMGQYRQAITWFEQSGTEEAKQLTSLCQWALDRLADSASMTITHLDKQINSEFSDFGPLPVGDTLYFSSYRFQWREDTHDPQRRLTQVMMHLPGRRRSLPVRQGLNLDGRHTAHLAISEDGRQQYFAGCSFTNTATIKCDLYVREKRDTRRWYPARQLDGEINFKGASTTQPALGREAVSGQELLFFASDRPGGQGGHDIWLSRKDSTGTWAPPAPVANINTSGDEVTPFFHTPTQTLYFSSDGHQGMGGFDIYAVSWPPVEHQTQHLPVPLNGSYNDLDFTPVDTSFAYFASNRPGSYYLNEENKTCCNDLYTVTFHPLTQQGTDTSLTAERDRLPAESAITADTPAIDQAPTTLEAFLPLRLYFDNDQPDPRSRKTSTRLTYPETFGPYYGKKQEFTDSLLGDNPDSIAAEVEDFFEQEVLKGFTHLELFTEILNNRLSKGEVIEIFIKGFTSPRAQSTYNRHLGERRVQSLINHFTSWNNQTLKPYLEGGQLILSRRSFGEETAQAGVSDDLSDLRGSVYSLAASRERRVEIVEVISQ